MSEVIRGQRVRVPGRSGEGLQLLDMGSLALSEPTTQGSASTRPSGWTLRTADAAPAGGLAVGPGVPGSVWPAPHGLRVCSLTPSL